MGRRMSTDWRMASRVCGHFRHFDTVVTRHQQWRLQRVRAALPLSAFCFVTFRLLMTLFKRGHFLSKSKLYSFFFNPPDKEYQNTIKYVAVDIGLSNNWVQKSVKTVFRIDSKFKWLRREHEGIKIVHGTEVRTAGNDLCRSRRRQKGPAPGPLIRHSGAIFASAPLTIYPPGVNAPACVGDSADTNLRGQFI